jgi:hypothetical protein
MCCGLRRSKQVGRDAIQTDRKIGLPQRPAEIRPLITEVRSAHCIDKATKIGQLSAPRDRGVASHDFLSMQSIREKGKRVTPALGSSSAPRSGKLNFHRRSTCPSLCCSLPTTNELHQQQKQAIFGSSRDTAQYLRSLAMAKEGETFLAFVSAW